MNAARLGAPPYLRASTAAFDELLGRRVSMRSLALLRVLAGPAVLLHLQPFLADAADGRIYRDAFYEPYASWYPEVPDPIYVGLLWLAAVAAVAMSIGLLTRLATAITFTIVAYNLFLSTTHFHNNRAYLLIVLGLLAVAPCGRELSLDAWLRRARGRPALDLSAPAWPLWLLRVRRGLCGVRPEQAPRPRLVRRHRHLAARRTGSGGAGGLAPAGLGAVGPDRPRRPHRSGQADRAHRALHRGRAVVARQSLRGRLDCGCLSCRDRDLGIGTGLLVAGDRRAGDLGGAVNPRSGDPHRPGC